MIKKNNKNDKLFQLFYDIYVFIIIIKFYNKFVIIIIKIKNTPPKKIYVNIRMIQNLIKILKKTLKKNLSMIY